MFRVFKLAGIFRTLSLSLFFLVPAIFLSALLPVWVLPTLSILSVMLAAQLERTKLRLLPVFALVLASSAIVFLVAFYASVCISKAAVSSVFLRLALSYVLLNATATLGALSTVQWLRSSFWKTAEPLFLLLLFSLLFWSQGNHTITVFPHPVYLAVFTALFLFAILARILLQAHSSAQRILPLFAFAPIFLFVLLFVIGKFNALSVSNNGGLIQPTLFRFDFSPYLSLQNEIKMNDKLVLIVRTAEQNSTTLIRRIYLSGWNPEKGFFEEDAPGEKKQVTEVPGQSTDLQHPHFRLRSEAEQEYFIVNFDPSSLLAMDYPVRVTPYRIWNSAAFNGAFSVTSEITGFIPFELFDCPAPTGDPKEGLSASALAFYTAIDAKTRALVGPTAEKLTTDIPGYYDRIQLLSSYFRDGEFRYSLKPGVAPDGNQLRYFLEDTKKGYCTYFAFSLCLMLRSLDIPARISAGFFMQPDSGALDYYPVRANMAHAWVEVFFPDYGWIAFDPTSTKLAEGENIQINSSPGGDEFLQLLTEIIENRNLLVPENRDEQRSGVASNFMRILSSLISGITRSYIYLVFVIGILFVLLPALRRLLIIKYSTNDRKVILLLASAMYRTLNRAGKKRKQAQSRRAFIEEINDQDITSLFALEQQARYAQDLPETARGEALRLEKSIKEKYRRRIFSRFSGKGLIALLAFFLSLSGDGHSQERFAPEELLLSRAKAAIASENWESAIEILSSGKQAYPSNPSFPFVLGSLYSDQDLYQAARNEFLAALSLGYPHPDIYSKISEVSSLLNLDEEALAYIKRYLSVKNDDLFAWSNYGWLCYKTNRLDEGIGKLHEILAKYGPDSNLYVGLGNLYTAAFNYPDAKKYYTLAIQTAEASGLTFHASIDYYNRSILEEVFYNFEDAYQDTVRSLDATPRASGYLMQGELELRRHAFKGAFTQYLRAFNLDSTPLASMGLAETLIQAGYPDEATQYMNAIEKKTDRSWISNYGTTTNQFAADMHKNWRDIYKFRINAQKHQIVHSFSTLAFKYWNLTKYSLFHWYHDALFRIMNDRVARYYETSEKEYNKKTGQGLHMNSFYFMAFNKWHLIAEPFLKRARTIETNYIPAAEPSYQYEEAALSGNMALMKASITTLNPEWERQYLSKALFGVLSGDKHLSQAERNNYLRKLYEIHPAAFRLYGLRLSVSVFYNDAESKENRKLYAKMKRLLPKAGFKIEENAPYSVLFALTGTDLSIYLQDKNNNRTIFTQVIHNFTGHTQDIYQLVNDFSTGTFRTDIGL